MGLKIKRTGATEYGRYAKLLVAGDPGAGKTRFSSTWPHPFYANVEGGLMSVADRAVPYVDIASSEDLNALLIALRQPPRERESVLGVPVRTVIVDTLDAFQKVLVDERKHENKKDTLAIADWGWLGDQMRMVVRNFRNLDMNVIFTCHIKTESDAETGQTFVKPGLQGAMSEEIAAYVDIAGLLKAQPTNKVKDGKQVRVLQRLLQTGPDVRHPWLKDRSGKLPVDLEVNLNNDGAKIIGVIYSGETAPSTEVAPEKPAQTAKATVAPEPERATPEAPQTAEEIPETPFQPVERPEPEVGPVPTPEPVAPEPDVQRTSNDTPEPVRPVPTEPEPQPEPPAPTPEPATEAPDTDMICKDCGGSIDTEDQRDLSRIRFRTELCRGCFVKRKAAKK